MISGINLAAVVEYVIPGDENSPTVWKLGMIPSFFLGQIGVEFKKSGQEMEMVFKLVQLGLKGWSNCDLEYRIAKEKIFGKEVDIIPMELVEKIPIDVIGKLSKKIAEIKKLTTEESKN